MTAPQGPQQPPYGPPPGYGRPQHGPAQYGPPQHGGPRYGGPPPPPPRRKGSTGRILAIAAVVLVALLAAGGFAVYRVVATASDRVSGLVGSSGAGCDAVSGEDVDTALGGRYDLVQLDGGIGALAAPVLDSRVLAGAPTCWAVESGNENGRLARIARYEGADAAARFADEKRTATGVTEDRGNGVSVSTDPYLGAEVPAGDEAFCTTGDALGSAGALVRRGDTLVYVSTTAAGDGASSIPQIGIGADGNVGFATDKANCDLAVALAAKVR